MSSICWTPGPGPGLTRDVREGMGLARFLCPCLTELAVESNHNCHAQKGPGSHCDPKKQRACRQLSLASAICLVFMAGEITGGYLARSLAIMQPNYSLALPACSSASSLSGCPPGQPPRP